MERNIFLLLLVSILPVILLGIFVNFKDKNREPFKLILRLFIGGILSCFLTLFLTGILQIFVPLIKANPDHLNSFELIIYVFIGVALIEEFSKWIICYRISYNHKEFEEIYDMIVYTVFVALGFAFFENLLYVFQTDVYVGIFRALLAVPGHACDGIFMGYYLGLAKQCHIVGKEKDKKYYLILSILIPTVMHGIYDYCLFANAKILLLVFLAFVVMVYIFSFKKIKKVSSNASLLHKRDKFCGVCGTPVQGPFCANCGKKHNY